MKTYYAIKNYGDRVTRRYSIDQVDERGHYRCQEAFFFKTLAAAKKRLAEIIIEDKQEHGWESVEWSGISTPDYDHIMRENDYTASKASPDSLEYHRADMARRYARAMMTGRNG